jgi:hypothetical protein
MRTPWGPSTGPVVEIADGVTAVSSASHGGWKLTAELNDAMPACARNPNGFYEEDVEWSRVVLAFPDRFGPQLRAVAHDVSTRWEPDIAAALVPQP